MCCTIRNNNCSSKYSVLKVSNKTNVDALKTAIVGNLRENGLVLVDAIGVTTNYVAIRAIIKAKGEIVMYGNDFEIIPTLVELKIDGEESKEKTAVRWILRMRSGTV